MARNKKIIIYGLAIAAAIAVYSGLGYYAIFYRIGVAGLKTPDRQAVYSFGEEKTMSKNLLYAALGDSLTAGAGASKYEESYPYLLAQALAGEDKDKISLKNFSYPGAKTADLINDLLGPAVAAKPEIITLFIGVNDVYGQVSPAVFQKNYQAILDRLTKETKAKVYLVGLPYLGRFSLLSAPAYFYFHWRTGEFNEIIRRQAEIYNLKYIDLAASASAEFKKNRSYYSADLFHPSASGYAFWAKIIYDGINQ